MYKSRLQSPLGRDVRKAHSESNQCPHLLCKYQAKRNQNQKSGSKISTFGCAECDTSAAPRPAALAARSLPAALAARSLTRCVPSSSQQKVLLLYRLPVSVERVYGLYIWVGLACFCLLPVFAAQRNPNSSFTLLCCFCAEQLLLRVLLAAVRRFCSAVLRHAANKIGHDVSISHLAIAGCNHRVGILAALPHGLSLLWHKSTPRSIVRTQPRSTACSNRRGYE